MEIWRRNLKLLLINLWILLKLLRFHPSDEELIKYYLLNKVKALPLPADIIAETDLYNCDPWDLPEKATFGENEWYFFSPRYRKYPNGERPNRMAGSGFWKATGPDKPILASSGSRSIGVKKALVFYKGRPPMGSKTEWVMNEYRLPDPVTRPSRLRGSMRLDNWVLCRVRQKGNMSKNTPEAQGVGGSPSELAAYRSEPEEFPSAQADAIDNMAVISDALFKECPIVASILAGRDLPPIKSISSTTISSTNNSNICSLVFENDSSRGNTSVTSSSFDSFFNPWKGKSSEGNENQEILLGDINGTSFFDQIQSQGNIFNPDLLNGVMNVQEFNDSGFSESFLQY